MKRVYETNDGILKLEYVGWEEPNNGRDLLIPLITKNNIEITQELCDNWGGWNRIPQYINFEFSHEKLPFVFLPFEKNFILYDYVKNIISIIDLSSKVSNNRFIKNQFYEHYAIFISERVMKIKNLINNNYFKFEANENELFRDIIILRNNELSIKIELIEIRGNTIYKVDDKYETINIKNVV